ncbi:hypothetical protein V8F06_006503 [Rhypophila decipiens]
MADPETNHVKEYLTLLWNTTLYIVNFVSTTFRILFWILFACITAAILYDIGLYCLRTFASRLGFGSGAGQRPTKTIDADTSPTRETTVPPVPNGNSKKDR